MSEELYGIVRELGTLALAESRCRLLATIEDEGTLEALLTHYAGYDPTLFPDGRINRTLINARLLDLRKGGDA